MSATNRPFWRRVSRIGPLGLITATIAPAIGSMGSGADLDLRIGHVEWFDATPAWFALSGNIVLSAVRPAADWRGRLGFGLAFLGFGLAAAVFWSGGFKSEWLSISHAHGPVVCGWIGVVLASARKPAQAFRLKPRVHVAGLGLAALLGWGGLLLCMQIDAAGLAARMRSTYQGEARSDVILVVTDALRADALNTYGEALAKTPFLDAFAEGAVVFELAISQAPWTVPSMASMMSGLHPSTLDASGGSWNSHTLLYRFPPGVTRVAERFREQGYHTAAFVKNSFLGETSGFAAGYDIYEHVAGEPAEGESAAQLAGAVLRWAKIFAQRRRNGEQQPFFLYVHFMEPHASYLPPRRYWPQEAREYEGPFDGKQKTIRRFLETGGTAAPEDDAFLWRLYSGEVEYLDRELMHLRDELARLDLWTDDTIVLFTADHGEQFGEHGNYSHDNLQIENVHVPLLLRHPDFEQRRVAQVVRVLDIAPTILDLLHLPPSHQQEGRSLVPLMRGEATEPVPVMTEHEGRFRVTAPPYALLVWPERVLLYDLAHDPHEEHDIALDRPDIVAQLRTHLDRHLERKRAKLRAPEGEPVAIDSDTREALEELGYTEE